MQKTSLVKNYRFPIGAILLVVSCIAWNKGTPHGHYLITIFFSFWASLIISGWEKRYARRLQAIILADFWNAASIHPDQVEGDITKIANKSRDYIAFYLDKNKPWNAYSTGTGIALDLVITVFKGISIAFYFASILAMAIYQQWGLFYLLWCYVAMRFMLLIMLLCGFMICKLTFARYPGETRVIREWLQDKGYKFS